MGLFDKGLNLLRNISAENISEAKIKAYKEDMLLEQKYSDNQYVQLMLKNDFPKIIFGDCFLVDKEKTRNRFSIDPSEDIIGFILSRDLGHNLLEMEAVVLTDSAIYSTILENKIYYSSLDRYVMVTNGTDRSMKDIGEIKLVNLLGELKIVSKLIVLGTSGIPEKSLANLILMMQRLNISNDSENRDELFEMINKYLAPESCSEKVITCIEGLVQSNEATEDMCLALLRDIVYSCSRRRMLKYIKFTNEISKDTIKYIHEYAYDCATEIMNRCEDVDYIKKIKREINEKHDVDDLSEIELSNYMKFDSELELIKNVVKVITELDYSIFDISNDAEKYFCDKKIERLELVDRNNILLKYYEEELNDDRFTERERFVAFATIYKNSKAAEIFRMISKGEKPKGKDRFLVDGNGLTPLHYSIMLNKSDITSDLIIEYGFLKLSATYRNQHEKIKNIYDYKVWASYFGDTDALEGLIDNSPEIHTLQSTMNHLKRMRTLKKGVNSVVDYLGEVNASTTRKAAASGNHEIYEKSKEYSQQISEAKTMNDESIDEYTNQINEISDEIFAEKLQLKRRVEKLKEELLGAENGIDVLVRMYMLSGDKYADHLFDYKNNGKVLNFGGIYFYTNSDYEKYIIDYEKYNYKSDSYSYDGEVEIKYFSEEAKHDIAVLSKEYHILAAKYHPDNNPDAEHIFLEIQREREQILKNLDTEE